MKKIKGVLLIGILTFLMLGGAAGYYIWNNFLQLEYKSSYTLEEISEKMFGYQKILAYELEKELGIANDSIQEETISGNINISSEVDSTYGSGKINASIQDMHLQYQDTKLDFLFSNIELGGGMNMLGDKKNLNIEIGNMHLISNNFGSYLKVDDFSYNIDPTNTGSLYDTFLSFIYNISQKQQYIDVNQSLSEDIIEETKHSIEMDAFIIDFLKNEPIFIAERQENTRYHLLPSQSVCTFIKYQKNELNNEDDELNLYLSDSSKSLSMNYSHFKEYSVQCNENEYQEMIQYFQEGDFHTMKKLYVEVSKINVHFVFEIDTLLGETTITSGLDTVFGFNKNKTSRFYMDIASDIITGSGILIENNNDKLNGYIDIDVPEYNFDSNFTISGDNEKQNLSGGYNYTLPGTSVLPDLAHLEGSQLIGNIVFESTDGSSVLDISNTLTGKPQGETLGNINLKSSTRYSEEIAEGNSQLSINIPKVLTVSYSLDYDFVAKENVDSSFTTPKNILPQEEIDNFIEDMQNPEIFIEIQDGMLGVGNQYFMSLYEIPENFDIESAEYLDDDFIKDKNNVYRYSWETLSYEILEGSKPSMFQLMMEDYYAKDTNNIYYDGYIMDGVDLKSFEVIDDTYSKDKTNVYLYGETIERSNPKSFEVVDDYYAKDTNNIYYNGYIMDGVDLKSFEVIDDTYSKDKNNVYLYGETIEGSNPKSFEVINDIYSKDKNNVYHAWNTVEGADLESFEVINDIYSKDKTNVYFYGETIEGSNPKSFEIIDGWYKFYKDRNIVFYNGKVIEGADPKSFEYLAETFSETYYKDKKQIYLIDAYTNIHTMVGCDTNRISQDLIDNAFDELPKECILDEEYITSQNLFME